MKIFAFKQGEGVRRGPLRIKWISIYIIHRCQNCVAVPSPVTGGGWASAHLSVPGAGQGQRQQHQQPGHHRYSCVTQYWQIHSIQCHNRYTALLSRVDMSRQDWYKHRHNALSVYTTLHCTSGCTCALPLPLLSAKHQIECIIQSQLL